VAGFPEVAGFLDRLGRIAEAETQDFYRSHRAYLPAMALLSVIGSVEIGGYRWARDGRDFPAVVAVALFRQRRHPRSRRSRYAEVKMQLIAELRLQP
jgi:hypothetical protein